MRCFAHLRRILAALAAGAAVCGSPAIGQTVPNQADLQRAGLAIAPVQSVRMAPALSALGIVLDPAPLIRLSGDLAVADAAVADAEAKVALARQLAARSAQLYQGRLNSALELEKVQGDLGAARIALTAARARRQSLLGQITADWGPAVAAALAPGRALPTQLAAGEATLVGLSLPPGQTLAAPPLDAEAEAAGRRFPLHLVGPVPKMLGAYPGQSLLYRAAPQTGLPIGASVSARLPDGPERAGVVVPWSAVLWQGGHALVFRVAGRRFEPVPIAAGFPTEGGYLVTRPLAGGDRIVVRGAALLLGAGSEGSRPAGDDND